MIIECQIKPNSKKESIELDGNILKISVKAPPEDNKANKEVLRLLKRMFGEVELIRGAKSVKKLIKLPANDLFEVKTRIDES